ncbi:hypothetical protein HYW32_01440 [Candidatus Berkelbacteria bacterium]|nr:hypothetical protein [Candidatus Berkelbacteria bacterium]
MGSFKNQQNGNVIAAAKAGIVCLYGVFDNQLRNFTEMAGYRDYLRECAAIVVRETIPIVYLAGGHTNPKSNFSEAKSVERYFRDHLARNKPENQIKIELEERSVNTPQNIHFSLTRIRLEYPHLREVHIFTDRCRKLKGMALAHHLCFGFRHTVHGVPRIDTHPNSVWWKQAIQAFCYYFFFENILRDIDREKRR